MENPRNKFKYTKQLLILYAVVSLILASWLTGHILRHTYRTIAQRVGLDQTEARLLLDHAVPGIEGVYVHEKALFDRLLVAQERMTEAVFELCGAGEGK